MRACRCLQGHLLPRDYIAKNGTNTVDELHILDDFVSKLRRLQSNSHYKGACLLSGMQPTVDISSNPRTSTTPFSSVNPVFMVALIMWVTASFTLFQIADYMKNKADENLAKGSNNTCKLITEDFIIIISMVWNTVGIVFILVPEFRTFHSIPLNNAILGVVALLSSILVQYNWASFHMFDIELHEWASREAMGGEERSESIGGVTPMQVVEETAPENPAAAAMNGRGYLMFNTSNFLSTAASFAGVQSSAQSNHGLRKRPGQQQQHGRGMYAPLLTGQRMSRREQLNLMPNYRNMLVMGLPFAREQYRQVIKVGTFVLIPDLSYVFVTLPKALILLCLAEGAAERLSAKHGVHHHHPASVCDNAGCAVPCSAHCHGAVVIRMPSGLAPSVHPCAVPEPHVH